MCLSIRKSNKWNVYSMIGIFSIGKKEMMYSILKEQNFNKMYTRH